MHTVFTVEICGHHRPMKSHQPELIEKPCLHGCQIAVSKKRFGIGANDFQVQLFEQIIRSVTATGTKYSAYLRIGESPMQIVQPRGCSPRKERRLLAQCMSGNGCVQAAFAQSCHTQFDTLRLSVAGGRDNGDSCPRNNGRRFHHRTVHHASPIHISSAGPVSVISDPSPAQSTSCSPPGARTTRRVLPPRLTIVAAAVAHVPVPEELVGPTPRSKIRISMLFVSSTRTNSTFVWPGKSSCAQISRPRSCHPSP